jgi:signal transduction histidine kinase
VAERSPERAREALGAIEEVSKQTMTELRRTIGMLRGPADDLAIRPAPGLKDLDDLLEQVRRAGVDVNVSTAGERRELPASVDLSAYRILQEALTNVIKHAGPTNARVRITYEPGWLELVICDDGPMATRLAGPDVGGDGSSGGGEGLIGIRERVSMLGGSSEAGPKDHGFEVRARLPMDAKSEAQ